jgi:hypothetical protein
MTTVRTRQNCSRNAQFGMCPAEGAIRSRVERDDAVEDGVERVADNAQIREPTFIEDGHRGAIEHGLLNRVRVDVRPEGLQRRAILFVDGRSRKAKEAGVREAFAQVRSEASIWRRVRSDAERFPSAVVS